MTLYHVDIGYRQNVVAENYTRTKCIGNPDKMLPGDTGVERLNLEFRYSMNDTLCFKEYKGNGKSGITGRAFVGIAELIRGINKRAALRKQSTVFQEQGKQLASRLVYFVQGQCVRY